MGRLFPDIARLAECHRLTAGWHHTFGGLHHILVDGVESLVQVVDITEYLMYVSGVVKSTIGDIGVSAS